MTEADTTAVTVGGKGGDGVGRGRLVGEGLNGERAYVPTLFTTYVEKLEY